MNFFEYQDKAHRATKILIFYFILAVIAIVLSINAAVYGIVFGTDMFAYIYHGDAALKQTLWLYITSGVLTVIFFGTLVKLLMLRGGGRSVASMVNARLIEMNTVDANEQRLIHIVEEMAIASGVAMPTLYVMDNEEAINAFVAGTKPTDTVLVVTHGTLEALSRDELQGVVGHEFSHVFNGDMQINIRLMGILGGILVLGQMGRFLLRSNRIRSSSSKNAGQVQGAIALIAIAIYLIGYIGVFFGGLIKAAISRQREFLADASSVQYTRNPMGIAGALIKIKKHSSTSVLNTKHAEDISHMCFGESLQRHLSMLATHPPLDLRIKRLDESGELEARYLSDEPMQPVETPTTSKAAAMSAVPVAGFIVANISLAAANAEILPGQITNSIGVMKTEAVQLGVDLHAQIPTSLIEMVHDSSRVHILLLSLLTPKEEIWKMHANRLIEQKMGAAVWEEMNRLNANIATLQRNLYLPLVEISVPALLQNRKDVLDNFIETIEALSRLDNKITPFEFAFVTLLSHRIHGNLSENLYNRYDPVLEEIGLVLTFLLVATKMSKEQQAACYLKQMARFTKKTMLMNRSELKPTRVQAALTKLNGLSPALKQALIEALASCVIFDGKIEVDESELFRAIASCLDCPIPPLKMP